MKTRTVTERPIPFSADMVRAILDGRKVCTRRVIKPEWLRCLDPEEDREQILACSPYQVGSRLWVKEPFRRNIEAANCYYAADSKGMGNAAWRHFKDKSDSAFRSIYLPRRFSRITLEITGVRVERVQEITEADCWAEGLFRIGDDLKTPGPVLVCDKQRVESGMAWIQHGPPHYFTYAGNPRQAFRCLWDGIHNPHGYCADDAPTGWDANPFVWVIDFKRIDESK